MQRQIPTVLAIAACLAAQPGAQTKHPPAPDQWGQFESLAVQARGGLSPDGRWLAYGINRSSRENELRIRNIDSGRETVVAFGSQPVYAADSSWIAYSIGHSEAQEERLRAQRRPIQRKLGLLKLDGTSEPQVVDGIESFSMDPSGGYVAMRRYAPERPGTGGGGGAAGPPPPAPSGDADDAAPPGVTIIVRDLATGRDTAFGSVAEFAWQSVSEPSKLAGRMLAFTISTEDKTGNGIHLYDAASGSHRALDSSASVYSGLVWRRDADDLAVLRSHSDEAREGAAQTVLAWSGVAGSDPAARTLDPAALPAGSRTVSFRRPSWSDDGTVLFVGIGDWLEKPPAEKKAESATEGETRPQAGTAANDMPTVEIWHARDVDVMPRQKLTARADRQRNLLAAWHPGSGRLVPLAKTSTELVVPIRRQPRAYVATWDDYAMDRTIGRRAADVAIVDVATGERTRVAERINDAYLQSSPGGRYLLYFHQEQYWTVDTETRAVTPITKDARTSFADRESDATSPEKPAFGVAGWTKDDRSVLLYDKHDIWEAAADGSTVTRLTDGSAEQVRHRIVRIDPDAEWIDTSKPVYLSLFGTWSKHAGYARLEPQHRRVEQLIFEDRAVSSLAKARSADVYLYVTQKFDDSPDAYVGGPDLTSAKQVTATNPFMSNYAWGRSEVVEYRNARGQRLQGSLHYPANYEPGRRYPMVVYLYEKLSDNVHQFIPPSERDYYNETSFTSQGYVYFQPDIVFRPREPGGSVVESVEPAVKKIVEMGVADPARVGVIGHSWGGFDAAYLATHSKVFAAAVAGAAITNLVSNYGNHHWSSGIAETDHIETGQQRMAVPIYEDLPAYIRNSAVFSVHSMTTPLLLEVGDNDGTVHWHQGVEMYNIARRAKKQVVMLAYGGEDHGLRRRPNQIDYHRRIHQWFAHYLKGEPPAAWITSGLRYIDRDKELKKAISDSDKR